MHREGDSRNVTSSSSSSSCPQPAVSARDPLLPAARGRPEARGPPPTWPQGHPNRGHPNTARDSGELRQHRFACFRRTASAGHVQTSQEEDQQDGCRAKCILRLFGYRGRRHAASVPVIPTTAAAAPTPAPTPSPSPQPKAKARGRPPGPPPKAKASGPPMRPRAVSQPDSLMSWRGPLPSARWEPQRIVNWQPIRQADRLEGSVWQTVQSNLRERGFRELSDREQLNRAFMRRKDEMCKSNSVPASLRSMAQRRLQGKSAFNADVKHNMLVRLGFADVASLSWAIGAAPRGSSNAMSRRTSKSSTRESRASSGSGGADWFTSGSKGPAATSPSASAAAGCAQVPRLALGSLSSSGAASKTTTTSSQAPVVPKLALHKLGTGEKVCSSPDSPSDSGSSSSSDNESDEISSSESYSSFSSLSDAGADDEQKLRREQALDALKGLLQAAEGFEESLLEEMTSRRKVKARKEKIAAAIALGLDQEDVRFPEKTNTVEDSLTTLEEDLAPSEGFLLSLIEIAAFPVLRQRVKAVDIMTRFDKEADAVREQLLPPIEACKAVVGSKAFPPLLEGVLMLGNYVNAGSSTLGKAVAVTLDSLAKLTHTRCAASPNASSAGKSKNAFTLLVQQVEAAQATDMPEFRAVLMENLRKCYAARDCDLFQLEEDVKLLMGQVRGLGEKLPGSPTSSSSGEPPLLRRRGLELFLAAARPKVATLDDLLKDLQGSVIKLRSYFAEPPSSPLPQMLKSLATLLDALPERVQEPSFAMMPRKDAPARAARPKNVPPLKLGKTKVPPLALGKLAASASDAPTSSCSQASFSTATSSASASSAAAALPVAAASAPPAPTLGAHPPRRPVASILKGIPPINMQALACPPLASSAAAAASVSSSLAAAPAASAQGAALISAATADATTAPAGSGGFDQTMPTAPSPSGGGSDSDFDSNIKHNNSEEVLLAAPPARSRRGTPATPRGLHCGELATLGTPRTSSLEPAPIANNSNSAAMQQAATSMMPYANAEFAGYQAWEGPVTTITTTIKEEPSEVDTLSDDRSSPRSDVASMVSMLTPTKKGGVQTFYASISAPTSPPLSACVTARSSTVYEGVESSPIAVSPLLGAGGAAGVGGLSTLNSGESSCSSCSNWDAPTFTARSSLGDGDWAWSSTGTNDDPFAAFPMSSCSTPAGRQVSESSTPPSSSSRTGFSGEVRKSPQMRSSGPQMAPLALAELNKAAALSSGRAPSTASTTDRSSANGYNNTHRTSTSASDNSFTAATTLGTSGSCSDFLAAAPSSGPPPVTPKPGFRTVFGLVLPTPRLSANTPRQ